MSRGVFGEDYSAIKQFIYPAPAYRSFVIKKRGGGVRLIAEPKKQVKLLQLRALEFFTLFAPQNRPCVHGFVPNRSVVTNAEVHANLRPGFVLNIDLKDFFPSITFYRIRGLLQAKPFNFSFEVATVFAQLCTHGGKLPQGAPTSPFLSNQICRPLDRDLMSLAKRHRCTYTRYADDLTFSFSARTAERLPSSICSFDGGVATVGEELNTLIKSHSFELNEQKTRISSRHTRQEVTGLTINQFPNVQRKFVDSIRGALHAWQTYGYAAAEAKWLERVAATANKPLKERVWPRQTREGKPPQLHALLWGKLLYVRMVRPDRDPLYSKLAQKYNDLVAAEKAGSAVFNAASLPFHFEVHRQEHVQKAVYLVEWMGDAQVPGKPEGVTEPVGSQGTAFAYRRGDLLITCEHVLRCELDAGGMVDFSTAAGAMLNVTNMATGFQSGATLVARDQHIDVAVLKLDTNPLGMRHFIANPTEAVAGMAAHLIGFPNWSAGKPLTVEPSTVTNAFPRKGLRKFEVSSLIRKGNSGGPIASASFALLGVAQEGATQANGNNEALTAGELDAWLDTLDLGMSFGD
jgi:RNA-directed DNA polymerase